MSKAGSYFFIVACYGIMLAFTGCKHRDKSRKTNPDPVVQKKDNKNLPSDEKSKVADWQQKVGVSSREIKENKLYAFVNDWYGTPYKYGGCQKAGVDCSCFTNILYDKVYNKHISRSSTEIFNLCDKISLDEAEEGDLLFFKIGGQNISHVGIYLKKQWFVHSSTSKGVMVSSLDEAYYKKYFYCAGKMKNV